MQPPTKVLCRSATTTAPASWSLAATRPLSIKLPSWRLLPGHEMEETDTIAALLEKQVQSGVRWEVTVRRLAELGVDAAIEIGPGRALTGFVKKTVGSAISCYPVETAAQLQQLLRTMKGA